MKKNYFIVSMTDALNKGNYGIPVPMFSFRRKEKALRQLQIIYEEILARKWFVPEPDAQQKTYTAELYDFEPKARRQVLHVNCQETGSHTMYILYEVECGQGYKL